MHSPHSERRGRKEGSWRDKYDSRLFYFFKSWEKLMYTRKEPGNRVREMPRAGMRHLEGMQTVELKESFLFHCPQKEM